MKGSARSSCNLVKNAGGIGGNPGKRGGAVQSLEKKRIEDSKYS